MAFDKNRYHDQWQREHTSNVVIKLNHNTDADIIEWLSNQPSKMGAIKALIRAQIEKEQGN